jgi:hypothetical protein
MSAECRYLIQSTLQNEKLATHVVYSYKYHFSRNSPDVDNGKSAKLEHFRYTDCFTAMEKKNRDVVVNNSLFPRELWNIILEFYVFSWRDLIKFSCICKYWKDLSDHSFLWISCPVTFHLSRRLLLYFLKDYSTNVNPTTVHQESFRSIVTEHKTNNNDQNIVENCLKTISTTNFYQYRHIYKDLNGHNHSLVNAAQISLIKRIDGPEIFDSNFILRNTTLHERESLAYDMNRKVLHLLKEYSAWWDWNYFYRPKISVFMKITEEWIPNRLFNQIIYWIGAICLLLLLLVFNEDSMLIFRAESSFPSFSQNSTIPETSFPSSTDIPQLRLLQSRNLIGFGLVYLLLFSYLTLVVKVLIEYFCKEYILSSRIKNSFVFIPVEFTLDWKHVFRKDSVILLFLNLTFLIVGLIVSVLLLQLKFSISENPPVTSVTAILPHYLQVILYFFLSWKFIFFFASVIVFLFFFVQMKIVSYEYSSRNAHSSSSPSHHTFSLSNQLFSNDALYSFFFYFLLLMWFSTSVGNVLLGNYFDSSAVQDTSSLIRLEESRLLELHELTLYYFPIGFALLSYGFVFLLILLMLVLQSGINEMFVKMKLFTVPNMILLYCVTCGLVLVYSLTQLLLTGIGYSPEIAATSSTIPSYLSFSSGCSSWTLFLWFLNGFYGCVVGTLFLNSNII